MHNDPYLKSRRKELRNNATPQEVVLWKHLKGSQLGFKFRRQHSIHFYIVDFCCPERKIIIEIDGSQHATNKEYDLERTRYLEAFGYKVIRFWNNEINANLEEVLMEIQNILKTTPQSPPFQGGEA